MTSIARNDASIALDDLLIPTGQPGVFLRSALFDAGCARVQAGFDGLCGDAGMERLHSSGMVALEVIERSNYRDKFPQFVNRVAADPEAGDPQTMAALPSACLCLYPHFRTKGFFPASGSVTAITARCLRNETVYAPHRLRAFTMSEFVFVGGAEAAAAFRDSMLDKVRRWLSQLELDARVANASDPFFGRLGELLAQEQLRQELKVEILAPVGEDMEVACLSLNIHHDFFASRWGLMLEDGSVAHSCCVGVGVERLALALFHRHGRRLGAWPDAAQT